MNNIDLEKKINITTSRLLKEKGYISMTDLFIGLGYLEEKDVEDWRMKRIPYLERCMESLPSDATADIKLQQFLQSIYLKLEVYASELEDIPDVLCDHSPHGRPIVKKLSELFQEKLRPVLEEGIQDGIFEIDDMEATLAAFSFLLEFLNIDWIRHYEKDLRDRTIDVINNILLNGLKRRSQ